jgi:hypothetical protein
MLRRANYQPMVAPCHHTIGKKTEKRRREGRIRNRLLLLPAPALTGNGVCGFMNERCRNFHRRPFVMPKPGPWDAMRQWIMTLIWPDSGIHDGRIDSIVRFPFPISHFQYHFPISAALPFAVALRRRHRVSCLNYVVVA